MSQMTRDDGIIDALSAGYIYDHDTDSWVEVAVEDQRYLEELLMHFKGPSKSRSDDRDAVSKSDQWMLELVQAELDRRKFTR